MTREQVIERGLERIARGDWDDSPCSYETVKWYAGWLLRQTGNNDDAGLTEPGDGVSHLGADPAVKLLRPGSVSSAAAGDTTTGDET